MTLRRRTKVILVLVVIVAGGLWVFLPSSKAKRRAERLRRELKAEGFRTELSEFSFSVPAEVRNRAEVLTTAGRTVQDVIPNRGMGFFQPVGSNAAVVLSREERLSTEYSDDHWPGFRTTLERHKAALDAACTAALEGPIRFEPAQAPDGDLLLPYLADMRSLAVALTARTILELHQGHSLEAWTNLMALTRLTTAWDTGPVELDYMVKFYCALWATRATWETVQMHALREQDIDRLLKEWERSDVFKGIAETPDLSCATVLRMCEAERQRPAGSGPSVRQAIGDFFDSPGRGWSEMTSGWRESRYRNYGAYEDEAAAMQFYRQRKNVLAKATSGTIWAELRSLDSITNQLGLEKAGPASSRLGNFASQGPRGMGGGFMRQRSLVARAAETETWRRLICTALALEHFYVRHGSYPKALSELAPAFIPPVDCMDGKLLRYRPFAGTNFIVYSTGLDCIDDGGVMRAETNQMAGFGRGFSRWEQPDMIWPRAASPEESESDRQRREIARRERAIR